MPSRSFPSLLLLSAIRNATLALCRVKDRMPMPHVHIHHVDKYKLLQFSKTPVSYATLSRKYMQILLASDSSVPVVAVAFLQSLPPCLLPVSSGCFFRRLGRGCISMCVMMLFVTLSISLRSTEIIVRSGRPTQIGHSFASERSRRNKLFRHLQLTTQRQRRSVKGIVLYC